jgi:hypothetical protein
VEYAEDGSADDVRNLWRNLQHNGDKHGIRF